MFGFGGGPVSPVFPASLGAEGATVSEDNPLTDHEQLVVLEDVLRRVARASGLKTQDEEDFRQSVHLKLLERDYDVVRQFRGHCSLRTYLTVVVRRLLLDWRNSQYGKWRPSAAASRLGEFAIRLERLIHRDGFSFEEAVRIVASRAGAPGSAELQDLAAHLPNRIRRSHVPADCLDEIHATPFEDPIDTAAQNSLDRRARAALALAIRRLPDADRRLLSLRYRQGRSIQSIARLLALDSKALYRRYERLLRQLRLSTVTTLTSGTPQVRTRRSLPMRDDSPCRSWIAGDAGGLQMENE
jgi:RNA polymerase sigma factor (sigma-70 family)